MNVVVFVGMGEHGGGGRQSRVSRGPRGGKGYTPDLYPSLKGQPSGIICKAADSVSNAFS